MKSYQQAYLPQKLTEGLQYPMECVAVAETFRQDCAQRTIRQTLLCGLLHIVFVFYAPTMFCLRLNKQAGCSYVYFVFHPIYYIRPSFSSLTPGRNNTDRLSESGLCSALHIAVRALQQTVSREGLSTFFLPVECCLGFRLATL